MTIKLTERVTSAQHNFGTSGTLNNGAGQNHFNIPKMKYNFIIHFELTEKAKAMILEMHGTEIPLGKLTSFVIKDVALPSFSMNTSEINQYNRTRLMPGKIAYDPLNFVMYDTVNSSALLLLDAYKRFYYGDFSDKSLASWDYDMISKPDIFENVATLAPNGNTGPGDYTWGRSVFNMGDRDQGYFFKRIDIYEIDGSIYTAHNIHHPIISSVSMDTKTHESEGEPSTISLTMQHEGTSNICPLTNKKAIGSSTLELAGILLQSGEFTPMGFYKAYGEIDSSAPSMPDPNIAKQYPELRGPRSSLDVIPGQNGISGAIGTIDSLTGTDIGGGISSITNNISGALSTGASSVIDSGKAALGKIGGFF